VKPQTTAVITKDSINDAPAPGLTSRPSTVFSPAAAVPIVAKIPAPMIAPMPINVTSKAPNVRFRENCGPPAAARMSSRFFVRKIPRNMRRSLKFQLSGFKFLFRVLLDWANLLFSPPL
jgi:hypothetical protein